jgi:hypothetical protein
MPRISVYVKHYIKGSGLITLQNVKHDIHIDFDMLIGRGLLSRLIGHHLQWLNSKYHQVLLVLLVLILHTDTAADHVLETGLFETDHVDAFAFVEVVFMALEV